MTRAAPQDASPPQQLLQRITGHWVAQVTAVVARLGLADLLAEGPQPASVLAREVAANEDGLLRLLRGAVAAGLLEEVSPATFALTEVGSCLCSDVPWSMRDLAIAELDEAHWRCWGRLYDAVKDGRSAAEPALGGDVWAHYARHPEAGEHFARAMGNLTALVASEVARLQDFSSFARVADVGGSQGVLLATVLHAYPQCHGILFDLPHVLEGARRHLETEGLAGRVELVGGSFLEGPLPDADAYVLKSVLHDWDDAACTTVLRHIHRAAPPRARLLLVEMVLPEDGRPSPTALMDLNMLVLVGGRERTVRQLRALLEESGWALERITPTLTAFHLLLARPA